MKKLINGVLDDTNKMRKIVKVTSWKWKDYGSYTIFLSSDNKILLYEKFNNYYFLRVWTYDKWNYSMDLEIIDFQDIYKYTENLKKEIKAHEVMARIISIILRKNENSNKNKLWKRKQSLYWNAVNGLIWEDLPYATSSKWEKRYKL